MPPLEAVVHRVGTLLLHATQVRPSQTSRGREWWPELATTAVRDKLLA